MIRPKQAKKILPKSEFEQFETIIDNQTRRVSEERLKQKATISRRLRDKYRGLARHQSIAAKQKLTNVTDISQNEARAEIFQNIIDRIETELAERPNRTQEFEEAPTKKTKKKMRRSIEDDYALRAMADAKRREPA
jgi:hypothetical protein